jgi:hypothetical protein
MHGGSGQPYASLLKYRYLNHKFLPRVKQQMLAKARCVQALSTPAAALSTPAAALSTPAAGSVALGVKLAILLQLLLLLLLLLLLC